MQKGLLVVTTMLMTCNSYFSSKFTFHIFLRGNALLIYCTILYRPQRNRIGFEPGTAYSVSSMSARVAL
jgi:hypothetical protein